MDIHPRAKLGLAARRELCELIEAGVSIVCSTDAHSTRGLMNMRLAVATARRGWATAADVLNTRPLAELPLGSRR